MAGQRRRLGRDALHQIAIAYDRVSEMIDDIETLAVVTRRQMRLCHRHSDAVTEALAERSGGHLDAGRESALGVTGSDTAPLAKLLDLFERKIVTGRIEQAVQ